MLKGHIPKPKLSTSFFDSMGELHRQEKLLTLREFIQLNKMRVGQELLLIEIQDEATGAHTSPIRLFIGNCTFDHQPTIGDENSGWDPNSRAMDLYVYEVIEHAYNGMAPANIMRYFDNLGN